MKRFLALPLLIAAAAAHADTLGDMRAALTRLGGHAAIKATYQVQRSRKSEGRFVNDNFTGAVTIELESDNLAFRLVFPQTLLTAIHNEEAIRRRDPKKDTPTLNALWEVSPVTAAETLNYAPVLLEMIDGAKFVSDRPAIVQGKPGHVLVLDLAPPKAPSGTVDIGKITIEVNRLTIWIGDDGVPSAAEHVQNTKASAFIFKAESQETTKWTFGRDGDRLLRLRYEKSGSGSGLGQKAVSSIIATLTPHP